MFDNNDTPYLDLQMWYASCNLGYKNPKISNAVIDCINSMPQIASRFLFENKVLLASKIARANEKRFNIKGRVHFNVGGAQAVDATMAKNAKIAIFIALSNLKRILKANINLSMTRLQENQNM